MENKINTGYLCFLIILKMLGMTISKEQEERIKSNEGNFEYELLLMAKELHLKAKIGKLKVKIINQTTIPIIARLKDGNYILLIRNEEQGWFF